MRAKLAFLSALIAVSVGLNAHAQDPQIPIPTPAPGEAQVEDVVVVGSALEKTAKDYVSAVAAPIPNREAAAWRDPVCVGVAEMNRQLARVLADRVSDWAYSLGVDVARPGCRPNIIVVATDDGDVTARDLVASRPRQFATGIGETDLGKAALSRFQSSGQPIRWWHVSLPVSEDTGRSAVRLPGQEPYRPTPIARPADLGSYGILVQGSRLSDPLRDDLQQVIIVLDVDALDQAEFGQIADYVSMVALAQVDPDARPATPSILNLFEAGAAQEPTLSRWDQAYLRALYSARLRHANRVVGDWTMAAETVRALNADTVSNAVDREP